MQVLPARTAGPLIRRSDDLGTTFIYTTPPEPSCSGTVLALQYCYQANRNRLGQTNVTFFRFLHLNRSGYHFIVNGSITMRTSPHEEYCSVINISNRWFPYICCDTTTLLTNDQFHIPASNYTFGVVIRKNNIRPLAFSSMEYQFPHFQARPIDDDEGPGIGVDFTLGPGDFQSSGSLLLLRFLIGMTICMCTLIVETKQLMHVRPACC